MPHNSADVQRIIHQVEDLSAFLSGFDPDLLKSSTYNTKIVEILTGLDRLKAAK